MKLFGVCGWKNNGKTTLVTRLVRRLSERGLAVSTLKHAHHAFDIDHEGKDSHRHREAGAREVLVASAARWALIHEARGASEPSLAELVAKMTPVDLLIVEGFKRDAHPKLEVHRGEVGRPLLAREDPSILAVASDVVHEGLDKPVFDLDDVTGVAEFILAHTGLCDMGGGA